LALACARAFAATVDPALAAQAEAGGRVEALIVLPDQATPALTPLAVDADYRARRRALVGALRARADAQQAGVLAWLRSHGIEHRAYWISNLVWARLSRAELAEFATRGDVARIDANPHLAQALPAGEAATQDVRATESIEYGVAKINAPALWALGYTGQGVVVAGEDTGYRWDHAALKPHYRGWDGSNAVHDRNWHDAIHDSTDNPCGNDAQAPCDDHGHGTHTAGTSSATMAAATGSVLRRARNGSAAATWTPATARPRATSNACNGCSRRPISPGEPGSGHGSRHRQQLVGLLGRRRLHQRRRDQGRGRQPRRRRHLLRRRRRQRRPGLRHDHRPAGDLRFRLRRRRDRQQRSHGLVLEPRPGGRRHARPPRRLRARA
jgi:subtilisin family serine protease